MKTEVIKSKIEQWKHLIAFIAFGGCAGLLSFGVTSLVYRDFMTRQAESHLEQIKSYQAQILVLTEQLGIERNETRQQLASVTHQLLTVGSQLSTVGAQVQSIADFATRVSTDAAKTAEKAANTAKNAANTAKKAAQELKALPASTEGPRPPPPRKRRAPKEYIEP